MDDKQAPNDMGVAGNRWMWKAPFVSNIRGTGLDVAPPLDTASDQGQYAATSRDDSGSNYDDGKGAICGDAGSYGKPPDVGERESSASAVTSSTSPSARAPPSPANLCSKSAPAPTPHGKPSSPSRQTTFGQLLDAIISSHIEPFYFRKFGTAHLGCWDGACIPFFYFLAFGFANLILSL